MKLVVMEGHRAAGRTAHTQALVESLRRSGRRTESWQPKPPNSGTLHPAPPYVAALDLARQRAIVCAWAIDADLDVLVVDGWWHSAEVSAMTSGGGSLSALSALIEVERRFLQPPHAVFVFDVPDEVMVARVAACGLTATQDDRSALEAYRQLAAPSDPLNRFWGATVVDGNRDRRDVLTDLVTICFERIAR